MKLKEYNKIKEHRKYWRWFEETIEQTTLTPYINKPSKEVRTNKSREKW